MLIDLRWNRKRKGVKIHAQKQSTESNLKEGSSCFIWVIISTYYNTTIIVQFLWLSKLIYQTLTLQKIKILSSFLCNPSLFNWYIHPYRTWNFAFNSHSASHDSWCTAILWNRIMTAQCEGMGEVGLARYEPALLPPCLSIRVLSYSNCQEIHSRQQTGLAV